MKCSWIYVDINMKQSEKHLHVNKYRCAFSNGKFVNKNMHVNSEKDEEKTVEFIDVLDGCGCHPSLPIQRHKCNDRIWFVQSTDIITFNVSYQFFSGFFLFKFFFASPFDKFTCCRMAYLSSWMQFAHQMKCFDCKMSTVLFDYWRVVCCWQIETIAAMKVNQFLYWSPYFQKDNRKCMQRPFCCRHHDI